MNKLRKKRAYNPADAVHDAFDRKMNSVRAYAKKGVAWKTFKLICLRGVETKVEGNRICKVEKLTETKYQIKLWKITGDAPFQRVISYREDFEGLLKLMQHSVETLKLNRGKSDKFHILILDLKA